MIIELYYSWKELLSHAELVNPQIWAAVKSQPKSALALALLPQRESSEHRDQQGN